MADNLALLPAQVSPYVLSNPTPPAIQMMPGGDAVEYHQAMRNGLELWTMTVQAIVANVGDIAGQKRLDEFLASTGSSSVKAAIESDKTLGGAVMDLIVRSCSGYREYARADGGGSVLGAEWTVDLYVNGG